MRVTVEEPVQPLGIEKQSVKKRIQRRNLRSEKDGGGTTYVYVDTPETVRDGSEDGHGVVHEELVEELRDRVAYLEHQVEEEREARSRADKLLAQLMQRVPQLEPPSQEPPSEPSGAPTEATEQPGRVEPPASVEGQQTPSERVSWWSRLFGGGQ